MINVITRLLIGSVWVFHGFYSKLLDGIPRHRLIAERVLGEDVGSRALPVIGVLEMLLGLWVFSGRWPRLCAVTQTLTIVSMNTLEIWLAKDLLISAPGMVLLNTLFLAVIWRHALNAGKAAMETRPLPPVSVLPERASGEEAGQRRPDQGE